MTVASCEVSSECNRGGPGRMKYLKQHKYSLSCCSPREWHILLLYRSSKRTQDNLLFVIQSYGGLFSFGVFFVCLFIFLKLYLVVFHIPIKF